MIGGFLDRISGLLDKGLILGALFPVLIVGLILTAYGVTILGWRASLFWLDDLSGSSALALAMLLTIVLFLSAFVLRSLRTPILRMWSGAAAPEWLQQRQAKRRKAIETDIERATVWENASGVFGQIESKRRDDRIPDDKHTALLLRVRDLLDFGRTLDEKEIRKKYDHIVENLVQAYKLYDYEGLIDIYEPLREYAESRETEETVRRQGLRANLALEFGPPGIISATRLGNVLQAIDTYPYQRYRMEGSTFWPHLEQVMEGDLLEDIRNQRILLDSSLASATLFASVAALAIAVGPWIWLGLTWVLAAVVAGLVAYGSYLVAVPTAAALSRALRAGCDLYRRDLLFALDVDPPRTLETEKVVWERLSRLVIYGDTGSLTFRSRPERVPDSA